MKATKTGYALIISAIAILTIVVGAFSLWFWFRFYLKEAVIMKATKMDRALISSAIAILTAVVSTLALWLYWYTDILRRQLLWRLQKQVTHLLFQQSLF